MKPAELAEGQRLFESGDWARLTIWLGVHAYDLLAAAENVRGFAQMLADSHALRGQLQAEVDRLHVIEESVQLAFGTTDADTLAEYAAELQNLRRWGKL